MYLLQIIIFKMIKIIFIQLFINFFNVAFRVKAELLFIPTQGVLSLLVWIIHLFIHQGSRLFHLRRGKYFHSRSSETKIVT